jgi:tripartite-type tricarboxylate transporter receptor subunit TctC
MAMSRLLRLALASLALISIFATASSAQDKYPSRPIRLIVPYGPGATDTVTRILADQLRQILNQPVVVENKPGALGLSAMEEVVKAKPDGYTLMMGNVSTHGIAPILYKKKFTFDFDKSIVPVIRFADTPSVLAATRKDFPPSTLKELAAYAKTRPGIKYAVIGIGAFSHIDSEVMGLRMGVKFEVIPYKASTAEMVKDTINGDIHFAFFNVTNAQAAIKAGQLKALAMVSPKRLPDFPEVPTMAEAGYPDVGSDVWIAMFAPAGTPADALDSLNKSVHEALTKQLLKDAFARQNILINPTTDPASAHAWLKAELARWEKTLAETRIEAE